MRGTLLCILMFLLSTLPLHGQKHVTAEFGGGISLPVGPTNDHVQPGFSFVAAAGPRLNRHFSVLLDFAFQGMHVDVLQNASLDRQVDGQMYLWSLTLNPNYEFIKKERFSTYVTGGYGLYYRWLELTRTDFGTTVVCDGWWGICEEGAIAGGAFLGHRSTYKGGFNSGFGITYGSAKKLFVEVRYHRMLTTNRPTEFVPIVAGVRW